MAYQGHLDALCGPYAIVNAYELCDEQCKINKKLCKINEKWRNENKDISEEIFQNACKAIKRWPNILWEGTTFRHMQKMLKVCQEDMKFFYDKTDHYPIKIEYPFDNTTPKTNKEYWSHFTRIFDRPNVICGIALREYPDNDYHWFAFRKKKKTLDVFDSTHPSENPVRQLRIANIHAGKYQKGKKVVISRRELIIFVNKHV